MTTLWDTTGAAVVEAIGSERRLAGALSSGLALTLVVVVDESRVAEAEQAATRAAAQHPCRLLIVVRRRPEASESRLDAEVIIGGRLGPGEAVVMRMYGRLALHAESVVLPLLAPDAPILTWWYGEPPHVIAHDPLGVLAERRVTDAACAPDPLAALAARAQDYVPGDTDLAWTRTTSWRSVCASALDAVTSPPTGVTVGGPAGDPSRALLAGWLTARLGIAAQIQEQGPDLTQVVFSLQDNRSIALTRDQGEIVHVKHTDRPDRTMPLAPRKLGDLLTEELRRLDPDETYADALRAAHAGVLMVNARRTHLWVDPAEVESALVEGRPRA